MKKLLLLLTIPFILSACSTKTETDSIEPDLDDDTEVTDEVEDNDDHDDEEIEEEDNNDDIVHNTPGPVNSGDIPSFYRNGDIEYSEHTTLDANDLIDAATKQEIVTEYFKNYSYGDKDWESIEWLFEFYEVGTIKVDPYLGWKLVVLDLQCDGMCFRTDQARFAWNESSGELTALSLNSTNFDEYMPTALVSLFKTADVTLELDGINPPSSIPAPNGEAFKLDQNGAAYGNDMNIKEVAFVDKNLGTVYKNGSDGCLFVQSPDGGWHRYSYDTEFFSPSNSWVIWDEDSTRTNLKTNYNYARSGCGLTGGCYRTIYTVDNNPLEKLSALDPADLVSAGKSDSGIELYEAKNPKDTTGTAYDSTASYTNGLVSGSYNNVKNLYEYQYPGRDAPTFEDWYATHPILFFQDPLERWSYIISNDSQTPAECGKPIVYLYPEETMDINVQVEIDEFTETIPHYGPQGWTVSATPDSQLYNYADGETYPYLFWEGIKNGEVMADRGSMVARADLPEFLDTSLTTLGLNGIEKADFLEYWEHNMLEAFDTPYFYISWVGTNDFNKIAPLHITPEPDTLIRVFMYYEPTVVPFTPRPQELSTIPRQGFTVVEWGGSPKPWTK